LLREPTLLRKLVAKIQADIGQSGSLITWHVSFEKKQNKELSKMFPDYSEFFDNINERIVDLEDVFKTPYVDVRFDGSTSIKKLLPVVCQELNYKDLGVQDGAAAMEAWQRMILAVGHESDMIAKDLLEYCEWDTFAMVNIYRFLIELCND
jgi:hypothetical protein